MICHYCGYNEPIERYCPNCKSGELRPMGFGTERVEEAITELFPDARVLRLDGDTAKLFHLEMWAFVHGIAVIIATDYLKLDRELVSRMLTDCYTGLRKAYGRE